MKQKSDLSKKKLFWMFIIILGIILLFTLGDYFVHILDEEYAVPSRYFTNKIIYGTIIGFISYLFIRKQKIGIKSLLFSLIVSLLLQTRYFLEGYLLSFVILFFFIHFIILFPISWIIFYLFDKRI